jgi:CO/xanthine dehydrogenase FAD-binding subunit
MSDPISDAHASANYRRKMVKVFVKRALALAAKNA